MVITTSIKSTFVSRTDTIRAHINNASFPKVKIQNIILDNLLKKPSRYEQIEQSLWVPTFVVDDFKKKDLHFFSEYPEPSTEGAGQVLSRTPTL